MEISTVAAFLSVDLLLVITPGADWAYVIGVAVRERAIVPAVAGVVAGYAGHTVLVAAGVAVIVATTPGILTAMTVAGAAYLAWLGIRLVGSAASDLTAAGAPPRSRARIALRGAGTSGLNPKGLLLYLALIPQFVHTRSGWPVAAQAGLLGALHMVDCGAGYLAIGALARAALADRPMAARAVTRAAGVMMIVIGGALLAERLFH
jgi:threonine/homoserine/homoserine lactone efflux protein